MKHLIYDYRCNSITNFHEFVAGNREDFKEFLQNIETEFKVTFIYNEETISDALYCLSYLQDLWIDFRCDQNKFPECEFIANDVEESLSTIHENYLLKLSTLQYE